MSEPDDSLNDDFRDMLACLLDNGADFVVVGAHALAAHGLPRATGDIDILVRPSPDNAARVMRALRQFGAPVVAHGTTVTDFEQEGQVYQLGVPPRRIDLLTSIDGVSYDEAHASRIVVDISGLPLPFLGRDALIANKRAVGRPKDLVDVGELTKPPARRPR